MASMSSSGETFLDSLRAFFSSALAVFLSVFSFPFPGFFVFLPILDDCLFTRRKTVSVLMTVNDGTTTEKNRVLSSCARVSLRFYMMNVSLT
ncbi:hypothetical protein Hanom_Chr09g00834971 [Helianthus anomalus]